MFTLLDYHISMEIYVTFLIFDWNIVHFIANKIPNKPIGACGAELHPPFFNVLFAYFKLHVSTLY